MFSNPLGAQFRRVESRQREGRSVRVVVASRVYDTGIDDLWNALTSRERIPRWFLPIEGDLKPGGRYQLTGNAGGTILQCDPPRAFDITWEFGGGTSWVTVLLVPEGAGTLLTLEHSVLASDTDEHWTKFGPGAVGVGWDLTMEGLAEYLGMKGAAVDHAAAHAWMASDEGKDFMRKSGHAWADAHIQGGENAETARAMAARTIAFYTGG